MDRLRVGRRALLVGSALSLGMGRARAQAPVRLRSYWWGAKERADRTERVNALFTQRNPNITITGETVGWGDYWTRLATQAAGRNMADLIQMDFGYIFEYARRKALLPLDPFVGKQLDLSGFTQSSIAGGKVDGKIYGVSLGLNSTSLIYDRTAWEKAGIVLPDWPMSWSEFARRTAALTKAVGREGFWGTSDAGNSGPGLEVWLKERGKPMYTEEGKFGASAEDMAEWFAYWQDMRTSGACVPPDVQALDKGEIDTSMLTLGKASVSFANSNQLVGYQALNKSRLDLAMYPAGEKGGKSGQFLKPSQFWSVAATTKYPDETVKLLSFFVADPDAGKLLGVERGIPASSLVREAVAPTLDDMGKRMLDYVSFISDKVSDLPPPPPRGAGEVLAVLVRTNQSVGFKRLTPAQAGKQFLTEVTDALSRG